MVISTPAKLRTSQGTSGATETGRPDATDDFHLTHLTIERYWKYVILQPLWFVFLSGDPHDDPRITVPLLM